MFVFAPERFSRSPRNPFRLAPESAPEVLEVLAESADETLRLRIRVRRSIAESCTPIPEYGYLEFKAYLTDRYSARLMCDPPEIILRQAFKTLEGAGVTFAAFRRRLDLRDEAVTSWGIIPRLAEDCAVVFRRIKLPAPATGDDFAGRLRASLLACAGRLRDRPEYGNIVAELEAMADNAEELSAELDTLDSSLQRLESQMLSIAEQHLSPAQLAELLKDAEASCERYIDNKTEAERARLREQARERSLAELAALPRLSLFYR